MSSNPDIRVRHDPAELDEDAWSRFVLDNENGNVFQTPEMYQVLLETEHYEPVLTALVDKNEEILAVMLGVLIEEPGVIKRRFSRRIIVNGGPLLSEKGNRDYLLKRTLKAHNYSVKRKSIFTEIRNLSPQHEFLPQFESVGYNYSDHLNFLIKLDSGVEDLWRRLNKKRRTGIRKALKNNLTSGIITLADLEDAYKIVNDTYRQARIPAPPKSLIKSVISILQSKGMARIIGIKYQDEIIAVIITLIYKDVIFDWYAAGNRKYSSLCANEYAVWVALEWATKNGLRVFDFGGAGRPDEEYGVRQFKSQFGGQQVKFGRFTSVHNRLMHNIAQVGFKVWRELP